jgi:hypothetical protein
MHWMECDKKGRVWTNLLVSETENIRKLDKSLKDMKGYKQTRDHSIWKARNIMKR